ncbi:hypothetical protein J6590_006613 [Homalodisca vitripennis]|nr:hypothetical protein J6590_006613 [Homalodisca vitripennis]
MQTSTNIFCSLVRGSEDLFHHCPPLQEGTWRHASFGPPPSPLTAGRLYQSFVRIKKAVIEHPSLGLLNVACSNEGCDVIGVTNKRGLLRDHIWLVYIFQLNQPLGTAKTDVSGTSLTANVEIMRFMGNSIDLVYCGRRLLELVGFVPEPQRFLLTSTRMCHILPTLIGEAVSELASPSSGET